MSVRAVEATWRLAPRLDDLLAPIDEKRRPATTKALVVALRLADQYRDARGYTDETVEQLAAATTLTPSSVRAALQALEHAGVWVVAKRGARGRGTQRIPGTALELRGADPTEIDAASPRGSDANCAGYVPHLRGVERELRGVDPATPRRYPGSSPAAAANPVEDAFQILARQRGLTNMAAARNFLTRDGTLNQLREMHQKFPERAGRPVNGVELVQLLERGPLYAQMVRDSELAIQQAGNR